MAEGTKSFWQTAPGVITAVAALITALGGVLGILIQNDVIGGGSDGPQSGTTQGVVGTPGGGGSDQAAPGVTTAQPTSVSTLIPWTQATATLVRKDGTSATVNASSVRLACGSENLGFENGQQISLQLVRSIQFDAIYMTTGSADAVVTLLDGQQLTDAIRTRNCPVHGENELGQLDIGLEDIERIDFRR
jgi:hypothetical protein